MAWGALRLTGWLAVICAAASPPDDVSATRGRMGDYTNFTDQATNEAKAKALIDRLLKITDPRIRPNIYGPAIDVKCDFYVEGFGPLDSTNMEYHMNAYFRQRWVDPRLAFSEQQDPVMIPSQYIHRLWMPDIFFPNEKQGHIHTVTVPNQITKIFPDGTVRHSARLGLTLGCVMDLRHFPHDFQACSIRVSSYTYPSKDVKLHWLNDHPVEIYKEKLQLPEFEILGISHSDCKEELTTGAFGCITATFHLQRQIGYFILQAYLPSILIVVLSWVSFWISKEAVPARITLGVTTVLTMTTQLSSSRSQSMRVSYPKAMDVWYAMCMMFVFGALLEYALVNVLWRRVPAKTKATIPKDIEDVEEGDVNKNKLRLPSRKAGNKDQSPPFNEDPDGEVRPDGTPGPSPHCKFSASYIDHVSRYLFPSIFVLFNLVYWPVYARDSTQF